MWSGLKGLAALSAVVAMGFATPSQAAPELITNGNFSTVTVNGTVSTTAAPSQLNYNGYGVQGWTSSPSNAYTFLFNPGLSGSAAYTSTGQYGDIQLYTSANGGSATAPSSLVSPVGGNFIAADGAFQPGPISQTINNLTVGTDYTLSFYWAAAQQAGFTGVTTEAWGVSFTDTNGRAQNYNTGTVTNPDKGFTPWTKVTTTFRATTTTETLAFLASGGPSGGQPPFSLLDGVSLQAAPEPATWAVMVMGLGFLGFMTVRRRRGGSTPTLAA